MLSFDVPIIDGFDCSMDILGQLYDWSNKKKTGFKYLSFNDQTERKLSQADQKASRYLQNVVKQKRKKFSQFMFTGNCTQ